MFLYLDDFRVPKHTNFHVVRTYKDCIKTLEENQIDFISLDHDLGGEKTGYDVVVFMIENGIEIPYINIHSANPVGRDNMAMLIKRYFPEAKLTYDMKI